MSKLNKNTCTELDRLADAFVADILSASDADILAEVKNDGEDPAKFAASVGEICKAAINIVLKGRLLAAREAVDAERDQGSTIIKFVDKAKARQRLAEVLKFHPEAAKKLTLAARKEQGLSDNDVESMLEDLLELGLLPPEGDMK